VFDKDWNSCKAKPHLTRKGFDFLQVSNPILRAAAVLLPQDVGDAVSLDGKEPMARGGVTGHWSTWLSGQGRRWRGEGANEDVI
jgi:hypothetical protein